MVKPISCVFDDDKGVVTLEYEDGHRLIVLVSVFEESLELWSLLMESNL